MSRSTFWNDGKGVIYLDNNHPHITHRSQAGFLAVYTEDEERAPIRRRARGAVTVYDLDVA